ncbi:MAG: holo-ACP synthase [Gammaproteobacteria bacterium]|nr:holo-ACP synthase [Gammaproteobacteria bacterium]MCI0590941.1 holo-ACP synthase [Gammaproteobacteria bacterium]
MIYGIGVDIVDVSRMQENLDRYGFRFAHRILAENEHSAYRHARKPAHFLATRFAAKEALAKALGTGFRGGLSLQQIAVVHDELGRPSLQCTGRAAELLAKVGIAEAHLSLAHELNHALAFVALAK